jgi:hypothetical protein
MKQTLFYGFTLLFAFMQATPTEEYILSYPLFDVRKNIVTINHNTSFEKTNISMTQDDALLYVYDNDTSRLFCHGEYIDMTTEVVWGTYTDTIMPKKIGRITIGHTDFIFYTTKECKKPKDVWYVNIEMDIYDNYILKGSIRVHRSSDFEDRINSLINISENILFIGASNYQEKVREYSLIKLSENAPYINIVKHIKNNIYIENLPKTLKELDWTAEFGL